MINFRVSYLDKLLELLKADDVKIDDEKMDESYENLPGYMIPKKIK